MGFLQDFGKFLKEYNVVGLAVAFIIGAALTTLVQSLAKDIIMPIVSPVTRAGTWENATVTIGPSVIRWGPFLNALINFLILALVVFAIARYVLKQKEIKKI